MRVALAIAMATLTLGLASRPMHGQMQASDAPALETIHMVDQQTGWAVTDRPQVGVLLRSTDGGTHWGDVTPLSASGQKIRVGQIAVLSSQIAWVSRVEIGAATTEIFRTIDGGRTWKGSAIPMPAGMTVAPSVTSISFINPREGWLLVSLGHATGSEAVDIYHSTDSGETWSKRAGATPEVSSSSLPPGGSKMSLTFLNPTTGWITMWVFIPNQPYLYVTRDRGRTWRQQDLPLPPELTASWRAYPWPPKFFTTHDGIFPAFYVLLNDSSEETRMLVVLYATHKGGTTWTYSAPVPALFPVNIWHVGRFPPVNFADMNHGWVTDGDALYVTNDGGRRWTTVRPDQLFADVTQLAFISSQVGWAVRQTSPRLLKTLDGGRTWAPVPYTIIRRLGGSSCRPT